MKHKLALVDSFISGYKKQFVDESNTSNETLINPVESVSDL